MAKQATAVRKDDTRILNKVVTSMLDSVHNLPERRSRRTVPALARENEKLRQALRFVAAALVTHIEHGRREREGDRA